METNCGEPRRPRSARHAVDFRHLGGIGEQLDARRQPGDQRRDQVAGARRVVVEPAEKGLGRQREADFLERLAARGVERRLAPVDAPAGQGELPGVRAEVLGAPRQQQRRLAAPVVGDDDAYRGALQAARVERRVREAREVVDQARAQRGVERDRPHAAVRRARIEASATPVRISAMPAKWNQRGYSPRNITASSTASAGIRCMLAPARAAPRRVTT